MTASLFGLRRAGGLYRDPIAAIDWQAADPALPWLPRSIASLEGIADVSLPADFAVRFSRSEFARLCAAGLWLEGLLMGRITSGGFLAQGTDEARIALQEVREESGHGLMFLEMIERAGLSSVRLLGSTALLTWVARRLRPDDADFWAMVFIGESITDAFAVRALKESKSAADTICPVARQVLALHHRDEARHMVAARLLMEARVARMSPLRRLAFARTLRFLLKRFLAATLYPTPHSLAALGVADPHGAARGARACAGRRRLARACAQPALDLMARTGLLGARASSFARNLDRSP